MTSTPNSDLVPSGLAGVMVPPGGLRARRLQYDERRSPFDGLIHDLDQGELDLDPPYQRGHVWGLERQQTLIWSLTQGLPIGGVWINERDIMAPRVCIDGKQRITALAKWLHGELAVPAGWFEDDFFTGERPGDDTLITFDDLSIKGQRSVRHSTITIYLTKFQGDDAVRQEEALFDLVNFGGVPQGLTDPDAPAAQR